MICTKLSLMASLAASSMLRASPGSTLLSLPNPVDSFQCRSPSLGPISLISEAIDFCSWRKKQVCVHYVQHWR